MFTCTKKYTNLPFAHRQPSHPGHCRLIHGHNWSFTFTFGCNELEKGTGFVVDFGDLKWLKTWLENHFDHTLVLNSDDPALEYLRAALTRAPLAITMDSHFARIICVPNCGAEGLAKFVFEEVEKLLRFQTKERVFLHTVDVGEDEKNSAMYCVTGGCDHA